MLDELSYEYLKTLDKNHQYRFTLFHIIGPVYCCLSYNEDLQGNLYLDLINRGFTDECSYYNSKSRYQINTAYKFNKKNLEGLIKLAYYIQQDIIKNVKCFKNY